MRLLIEALAVYFTVISQSPVEIEPPPCLSLFCFCIKNAHRSSDQTKPSLCHRAVLKIFLLLHGDSLVPPCVTPSSPSPLLLHTGWISTLGPPVSLCNGITTNSLWWAGPRIADRELSPPMTEQEGGRVGGRWIWNSRDGSSKRITEFRKKKVLLNWDLRGNRPNKSNGAHGDSL